MATVSAANLPLIIGEGTTGVATASHDRAIVSFVSLQLFVVIYLQKFAVGGVDYPLSIPLLIMLGGLAWMVVTNKLTFDAKRTSAYLLFFCACLLSQTFAGGSFPSLVQLMVIYATLTITTTISETAYRQILAKYIKYLILPACIIIVQFAYQKLTGLEDPISMNRVFPQSVLLQGYFYEAHYPWYSTFSRPNGFFFLEPSYASAMVAIAAIIEITYFRRLYIIVLMLVALGLSEGATGISMMIIATPFLLIRERASTVVMAITSAIIVLATAYALNAPLPLVSRADELDSDSSSTSQRLLQPAERFSELAFDPSYFFVGDGAGTVIQHVKVGKDGAPDTKVNVMNPWPMVKVLNEYGLMSMILYTVLFTLAMAGNFNLPLKIAVAFTFLFSGGYLVNPPFIELIVMLFTVAVPMRMARVGRHR